VGTLPNVAIRRQAERRGFAGTMAGDAVLKDDGGDVFGESDAISRAARNCNDGTEEVWN
jgi:hypothetical protein